LNPQNDHHQSKNLANKTIKPIKTEATSKTDYQREEKYQKITGTFRYEKARKQTSLKATKQKNLRIYKLARRASKT
jgi:hypothetical protein